MTDPGKTSGKKPTELRITPYRVLNNLMEESPTLGNSKVMLSQGPVKYSMT